MTLKIKNSILLLASCLLLSTVSVAQNEETKAQEKIEKKAANEKIKAEKARAKAETKTKNGKEAQGDKYYDNFAYVDARETYLKLAETGYRSVDMLSKLGDSYYFTGDLENAEKWYGALYSFSEDIDPEYMYRYAQTLKSIGRYESSDKVMEKLKEVRAVDGRAELFSDERNYLDLIELQSGRFILSNVSFNSELSDFAPAFNGVEIVFASNRGTRGGSKLLHDWNDQPFTELYRVSGASSAEPKRLSNDLNTKYHESTACFTKDGQTMYFTRNNYTNNKFQKDGEGTNHLKLYKAARKGSSWTEATELPFNSNNYSVAHPALSPDEKTLYFASDMPGGKGMSDLYAVSVDGESYGPPQPLGNGINTEGRETFPFVDSNGELYFASDGHVGLGGLDIFGVEKNDEGEFEQGYNIGRPINSPKDDFTFVINNLTGLGYFASNRAGGIGADDIYGFQQISPLIRNCIQTVAGVVRDKTSKEIIPGAKVVLLNDKNEFLMSKISNDKGEFDFGEIECENTYTARANKDNYSMAEETFTSSSELDLEIGLSMNLTPIVPEVVIGRDLTDVLDLENINFDLDKSFIRGDAALELQKVIAYMRKYPKVKVDVRSHTDSRGSDNYNMSLSSRRNASTIDYIVNNGGIDGSRITGRGYGETALINHCSNGINCEDYVHEENRRSEFIVVE